MTSGVDEEVKWRIVTSIWAFSAVVHERRQHQWGVNDELMFYNPSSDQEVISAGLIPCLTILPFSQTHAYNQKYLP